MREINQQKWKMKLFRHWYELLLARAAASLFSLERPEEISFPIHLRRLCCSMGLYLRMSRKGPLNSANVEPAPKSSWWAHCCNSIAMVTLPFALFCHRQLSCTVIAMIFYIQIIIRSRLDQSVEENQDLKVRRGQMKREKERVWVKRSLQTLSCLSFFLGGGRMGRVGWGVDNPTYNMGDILC